MVQRFDSEQLVLENCRVQTLTSGYMFNSQYAKKATLAKKELYHIAFLYETLHRPTIIDIIVNVFGMIVLPKRSIDISALVKV